MGVRLSRPIKLWLSVAVLGLLLVASLFHPASRPYYDNAVDKFHSYTGLNIPGRPFTYDSHVSSDPSQTAAATFQSDAQVPLPESDEGKEFFAHYAHLLNSASFSFERVRGKDDLDGFPLQVFADYSPWSSRLDRLNMTDAEIDEMKEKHAKTLEEVKALAPSMPYVAGTRGIIMTTSIDGMGFMTVSLRMLRKSGTKLPVEIWFFDRSEWGVDPYCLQMCEKIWGPMDATCKFLTDYLPKPAPPPLDKEPYIFEHKLEAMLHSSFEQVLFLDSDNFPVMPVEELFVNEPFASKGWVLWPDYWADTSSHYWYEITGIEQPGVAERASTESGTILINKQTHAATLLMSSYYVRYAHHYSVLFSQDEKNEGDKEVYLKANLVLGLPWYQVKEGPERLGYRCDGNQRAIGSGQHHPGDDLFLVENDVHRGRREDLLSDWVMPRIMFIHGNFPKYNPPQFLDWYSPGWTDMIRCEEGKGKPHRMYGSKEMTILKFGWDVEKAVWDAMRWTACETEEYEMTWWGGTFYNGWKKRTGVCRDMTQAYDDLLNPEGLHYDDKVTSPYVKGGEFEQVLRGQYEAFHQNTWLSMRNPARWAKRQKS